MSLRWYTTVVDSPDPRALADWWAEALGWQKVYETDDEVTIIPGYATPELVAGMSWERVPPGLVFVKVDEHKARRTASTSISPRTRATTATPRSPGRRRSAPRRSTSVSARR